VPSSALGVEIAKYVMRRLEDGHAAIPTPLDADLVVRGSTGPAPSPTASAPRGLVSEESSRR
jgi:hypothetical protein